MTENRYFRVGGVTSPLSSSFSGSLPVFDLDPAIHQLITFLPAVINLHCGSRWNEEVAKCGLSSLSGSIVAQALPYNPMPISTENAWRFPLFAAYPTESSYEWTTVSKYSVIRDVEVVYLLPPLQSEQLERLHPFLSHIERTLVDRIAEGTDEDYNSGELVWKSAGISKIESLGAMVDKLPAVTEGPRSNIFFPMLCLKLRVTELRNTAEIESANLEMYGGIHSGSVSIASGSGDGGNVTSPFTDFVLVRSP